MSPDTPPYSLDAAQPVALFGGAFDPVHLGHMEIIDHLLSLGYQDKFLWVVPSRENPFKTNIKTPAEERLDFLSAVCGDRSLHIESSQCLGDMPGNTSDFIEGMFSPDQPIDLVVGADCLADLGRWHRSDYLAERVRLKVFPRPFENTEGNQKVPQGQAATWPDIFEGEWLNFTPRNCASRAIRLALSKGEWPDDLDPKWQDFASSQGLYGLSK